MVLENASASSQADSFTESTPVSDEDPYGAEGSNEQHQYHIDYASLPKPIPIFGSMLGYNQDLLLKMVSAKIAQYRVVLKREPTQDEAAAWAYWSAKQISVFSYATPIGLSAGLWRAWGTKDTFRFPFYQPNVETFKSDVFPHQRFAVLKGTRAFWAWHALRIALYGSVAKQAAQLLFGSYSMTVAAVGELGDKRLSEAMKAVKQKAQQKQGGLSSSLPRTDPETQKQGREILDVLRREQDVGRTANDHDDESAGLGADTGSVTAPQQEVKNTPWSQRQTPKSPPQWQTQDDRQSTGYDDASPTGGLGTRVDSTVEPGSAWDRIRRGEKPKADGSTSSAWPTNNEDTSRQTGESAWSRIQSNSQGEQTQGSTSGDNYSFSKSEEERNLAKAQAQKEFDAQVERERKGGDFNSGGRERRW